MNDPTMMTTQCGTAQEILAAHGFDFSRRYPVFPQMAEVLGVAPGQTVQSSDGSALLVGFEITEEDAIRLALSCLTTGGSSAREFTSPGRYVKLMTRVAEDDSYFDERDNGWVLMMSDTLTERIETKCLLDAAHGHVVVAGLGLGMLVHALACKPDVSSVTVVEASAAVVELIKPSIAQYDHVTIVVGDARAYEPTHNVMPPAYHYDVAILDIWPSIGETMYAETKAMRAHYERFCSRVEAWLEPELALVEDLFGMVEERAEAASDRGYPIDLQRAIGMFLNRWNDVLTRAAIERQIRR